MKNIKKFNTYLYMSQAELNQEFYDACLSGDLDKLKYVLHSPELKNHANMYYDKGDILYWSYEKKNMEIVKHLLYEEKYQFSDKLKKTCEENFNFNHPSKPDRISQEEIKSLFEKRDLYFVLNELPNKDIKKNKKI